mmetsp:Transcript_30793/g.87090  ORF Transcript_30793/g.87090 Transcript_30793/m.87090 type:complete len:221 (-) Transcript_30793:829-1491(-)
MASRSIGLITTIYQTGWSSNVSAVLPVRCDAILVRRLQLPVLVLPHVAAVALPSVVDDIHVVAVLQALEKIILLVLPIPAIPRLVRVPRVYFEFASIPDFILWGVVLRPAAAIQVSCKGGVVSSLDPFPLVSTPAVAFAVLLVDHDDAIAGALRKALLQVIVFLIELGPTDGLVRPVGINGEAAGRIGQDSALANAIPNLSYDPFLILVIVRVAAVVQRA